MDSRGKRMVALAMASRAVVLQDNNAKSLPSTSKNIASTNVLGDSIEVESDVCLFDHTKEQQIQPSPLGVEIADGWVDVNLLEGHHARMDTIEEAEQDKPMDDDGAYSDEEMEQTAMQSWEGTSRRRKSKPQKWKNVIRKEQKARGKPYTGVKSMQRPAKERKKLDCGFCRYKCSSNFTDAELDGCFTAYWNSGNFERQRDYIINHVEQMSPRRSCTPSSRKKNTLKYYLDNSRGRVRVCKKIFLATFDFSQKTVQTAMSKKRGNFVDEDKRGKHPPANKTSEEAMDFILNHIKSFPRMEPHYVRKDSTRHYLGQDLNIRKMYALYKQKCEESSRVPVKETTYRKTFNARFNLGFHRPKKDQCAKCTQFSNLKDDEQEAFRPVYDLHIRNKNLAQLEKEKDKEDAKLQLSHSSATFDLQSVLYTPCSQVSTLYYSRKLCMYNLTVYNQVNHAGHCYNWTEVDGKRGSTEIGTCIIKYVQSLPPTVKRLTLYSDSCGGQNKNRYLATAILYSVQKCTVDSIELKFLEPGHTYMECDSMHAAIEFAKKTVSINVPRDWISILRLARKSNPYTVTDMTHSDFIDLKKLSTEILPTKLFSDGIPDKPLLLSKVKCIRAQKKDPFLLEIKYSFDDITYTQVKQSSTSRKRFKIPRSENVQQTACYARKHPISQAKKKDLLNLCHTGAIPSDFHNYYENLPSALNMRDRLPSPCNSDSDRDSE